MINPITQRATLQRVLEHHVGALQIQLSKLDQGLRLAGVDPEGHVVYRSLVEDIRKVHESIGGLLAASYTASGQMYLDNRGLTP